MSTKLVMMIPEMVTSPAGWGLGFISERGEG